MIQLQPYFNFFFFFFNDTATTEIYTLSLLDALPISPIRRRPSRAPRAPGSLRSTPHLTARGGRARRSPSGSEASIPGSSEERRHRAGAIPLRPLRSRSQRARPVAPGPPQRQPPRRGTRQIGRAHV